MQYELPRVIVNYKAYTSGIGEKGLKLALIMQEKGKGKSVFGIAPQPQDLTFIARQVNIPVFAQHADPLDEDRSTGWVLPRSLAEVGVHGVLINHSEKPLPTGVVREVIELSRKYGLKTLVCASTPGRARKMAELGPDAIAVEPPELIGTKTSVSEAEPEVVTKAVTNVHDINQSIKVFVGAGIHSSKDASQALRLGAYGVLLASAVMKAEDVESEIKALVKGVEDGLSK